MQRPLNIDSERFGRINLRLPKIIIKRLNWLCAQREAEEGVRCHQSRILVEILSRYMPKHPDELMAETPDSLKKPLSHAAGSRRTAAL